MRRSAEQNTSGATSQGQNQEGPEGTRGVQQDEAWEQVGTGGAQQVVEEEGGTGPV